MLLEYKLLKYKVNDLIKAWRGGDEKLMEKLTLGSFSLYNESASNMIDVMINQRNIEMAEKIKTYLKDDKNSSKYVIVNKPDPAF